MFVDLVPLSLQTWNMLLLIKLICHLFINWQLSRILFLSAGLGYGSVIPDAPGADSHSLTVELAEKVGKLVEQYVEAMEKVFRLGNG